MRWKYLILFAFVSFTLVCANEEINENETDVEEVSQVAEVPVNPVEQDLPSEEYDDEESETDDSEKIDEQSPVKESETVDSENSEKKEVEESEKSVEETVDEDNVPVNEDVVDIEATPKTKGVLPAKARGQYINFDDYWAAEAVDFSDSSYNWNGE